jgi:RNA ligase
VVKQETGFSTLEDLYEYCKGLPATQEGFVVTFSNGLKVKIKGDTYCRIHKMISRMTPLAFWEAWNLELKEIPKEYLAQLPEEFRDVSDTLYQQIYDMHWEPYKKATQLHEEMKALLGNDADKKTWALRTKELHSKEFSAIMDLHNGKVGQMWRGIHRQCRPTLNIIPSWVKGADRIKRILQES